MSAPPISAARVEFDVPARMRDGVTLRANVYRPAEDGPWPTLMTRLPYGKDLPMVAGRLDPVQAAKAGFMVVVQDTRGRFASEGAYEPFAHEREDGYDSVEWAARLPGSNGRVGMYGDSYFGNTQWMAAEEGAPSLAAIAPGLTWSDPHDGLFTRGGAVELGFSVPWLLENEIANVVRRGDEESERRIEAILDSFDQLGDGGYSHLPVSTLPALREHGVSLLPGDPGTEEPSIAKACTVDARAGRVRLPSFHTCGWYDLFQQGTLDNFEAMAELGTPAQLVIGPWSHGSFGDPIGERMVGIRASRFGVTAHAGRDLGQWELEWFRRWLREDRPAAAESRVRLFVLGRNEWRDESGWPLARASEERWFLHADGSLNPDPPAVDEGTSGFDYDPADPVPTIGGNTLMAPSYPAGALDQRAIEQRDDVLVFTSPPLSAELEVSGRVKVVIHAQSSAPSTDWVARLCDVAPDGRSFNLCDGILRVDCEPGAGARYEIDLWSTSNVFLAGHRLRVHLTSSSFPRWDRNLNTGRQSEARHQVARQRLSHDAGRTSYVELPVVPR